MNSLLFPAFLQGRPGLALLLLRVVVGSAFVLHGSGKIVHAFTWMGPAIPGWLQAMAAMSEFGGGLALVAGLLTPLAALGLIGTMVGALAMVHLPSGHPFVSPDPAKPAFELPLIYLIVNLSVLLAGPGAYSLDSILFNRKGRILNDRGYTQATTH
jgi:putative oxidoreductase